MVSDEMMQKAMRYCGCCREPRRLLINGCWFCTICDAAGWVALNQQERR